MHDQIFSDVTKKKEMKRETPFNPLLPSYKIRDDKGELVEIGLIQGSQPTKPYFK